MGRVKQTDEIRPSDEGMCVEDRPGGIAVALTGDIDHHRAATLRRQLDELICQRKPRTLYMDMQQVEFMDSSGLGLIMGRYSLLGRLGGELVVCRPSAAAARMIALAAMERFIRIEK